MPHRLRRKLFNRPIGPAHRLYARIDVACGSVAGVNTAILNNLVLDHRVAQQREDAFLQFCRDFGPLGSEPLLGLLRSYQNREVQLKGVPRSRIPAYLRDENGANLLHGNLDFEREILDSATRLVTVKTSWQIEAGLRRRLAARVGSHALDPGDSASIAEVFFREVPEPEQGSLLLAALVESLNSPRGASTAPASDPGCVWAAFESDLRPYLAQEPSAWFEFLGLQKHRGQGIAFVIAYRASDTGGIALPTQLDAGVYPPHMPPPPPPAADRLARTLPWGPLCGQQGAREMLVHQEVVEQRRLSVLSWKRYAFDADGPTPEELFKARIRRLRFWSRVDKSHRTLVSQWISS